MLVFFYFLENEMTIKAEKLKVEGRLQIGDLVSTARLGQCEVATIESIHTITVKSKQGGYFRLSGLSFGNAGMVTA